MRIVEDHVTKYSNPNNPKIEKECKSAFEYLIKNIDKFELFIRDSKKMVKRK